MTVFYFQDELSNIKARPRESSWFAVGGTMAKLEDAFPHKVLMTIPDDPVGLRRWLERNMDHDVCVISMTHPCDHLCLWFETEFEATTFLVGCPHNHDLIITKDYLDGKKAEIEERERFRLEIEIQQREEYKKRDQERKDRLEREKEERENSRLERERLEQERREREEIANAPWWRNRRYASQ